IEVLPCARLTRATLHRARYLRAAGQASNPAPRTWDTSPAGAQCYGRVISFVDFWEREPALARHGLQGQPMTERNVLVVARGEVCRARPIRPRRLPAERPARSARS